MNKQINNDLSINKKPFNIEERPASGYTYIYIYSRDDIYIYVGQTIQSILARYKNHFSDNSGAHYANQIHCIQIASEYANFAEGYLASRLKGISQGTIPNYKYYKNDVPKEIRTLLQKIGNKLLNYNSLNGNLKVGELPIFTFNIAGDGNYATLKFYSKIVKEHVILWTNFLPTMKNYLHFSGLWLKELIYENHIEVYMITAPQADHRPICFFIANSANDIKEIAKIKSDFPIYCVINDSYYEKYQKTIDAIFRKSGAGILLDCWDKILEQKKSTKIYGQKDMKCSDLVRFFGKTEYRAQKSPYGYFQCA